MKRGGLDAGADSVSTDIAAVQGRAGTVLAWLTQAVVLDRLTVPGTRPRIFSRQIAPSIST